jgi:hypothetical protein
MPASAPASAVVANFSQFRLEKHVEKSLQKAWSLSAGRPLSAGDLLRAALLVGRTDRSKAFDKLAALLPLPQLTHERGATDIPPADLAALPLTKPLADSFIVAAPFLKDKAAIWGRDYITLALLAKDDPSLAEVAREAGSSLQAIVGGWFEFVCSSSSRRTRNDWQRWWRAAGVALQTEEPTAAKPAYLLTWDPKEFPFPELMDRIHQIEDQGFTNFEWETGDGRKMSPGERVFLLRQGADPRGLVGVGEVQGRRVRGRLDPDETQQHKLLTETRWTALSREPFLDLPLLTRETGESQVWSSRASSIQLDPALSQRLEEIWPRAWAEHMRGLHTLPDIEPKEWIARFDADLGASGDSLKLERYVHAFARVMASRNLTPPLSIGLFGDWGSGKTFFMDRLFDKIEELRREADGKAPLYWQNICQIRFNAWHYAETNLWASLVSTIFNELRVFLDGPNNENADDFNQLLNNLELTRELRQEAEKKVSEAETRHNEAQQRLEQAEEKVRKLSPPPALSEEQYRAILKREFAEQIAGAKPETVAALLESAAKWSGRPEFDEAAKRLRKGNETVEAAAAMLEEARALSSRAGFWWRVLCGARLYKTLGFWGVMAALLAIPAVFLLASRLGLQQSWANLWTLLSESLMAGGAFIAWARSRLSSASTVFDRLGSLQEKVARRIEEARSQDRREYEERRDAARDEETKAKVQLEQAVREERQVAEALSKAREALRDSTSQARLGRFIRERASSADYEKHLGLIAVIHRDFQRLSDIMEKARTGPADPALPRIDRIILYIDDLDRCYPPEKVVKILEAVHLLLFFPLFVVVVGVDSRWVSRSLHRHFEGMLADEAIAGGQEPSPAERPPAESQDFLEKIFQVPFWLRRMEPSAVQQLIHSLISAEELEAPAAVETTASSRGNYPDIASPSDDDSPETHASGTAPDDPVHAEAKRITSEAETDLRASSKAVDVLAPPIASLTITSAELEFMDRVAPLMPRTPRSVKRFVNIYRLYKAALTPQALALFLGTQIRPGNFRAVQVLLALVTGTPRLAQRVYQELQRSQDGSAKRLSALGELGDGEEAWQTTLEALANFAHGDSDLPLDELRKVSPLVARYSVHHMVSAVPGEAGLG